MYKNKLVMKWLLFLSFLALGSSFVKGGEPKKSEPEIKIHVIRLLPKQDVLVELSKFAKEHNLKACSIISSVGSLTDVALRYANESGTTHLKGHFEVVSLSGTFSSVSGAHIHLAVSDNKGRTLGGHMMEGNLVYTTLELVIAEYPKLVFKREKCKLSGYDELKVYKQ